VRLHTARSAATALLWAPALLLCAFAARYFLIPPPLLHPELLPEMAREPIARAVSGLAEYLYLHHRALLLTHIGCGIVALGGGLVQFIPSLRTARPKIHRSVGLAYLAGVLVGGVTGVPLAVRLLDGVPEDLRRVFYPSVVAFLMLSPAWVALTAMAWRRALQRRFEDHRAWMIRSYSLTFAAVTARVWAPLFLVASGDPVLLANGGIALWPLNLVFAEWLIRRRSDKSGPVLLEKSSASLLGLMFAALLSASGCKRVPAVKPDDDIYRRIQTDLIRAKPGDVVELPEGKFHLNRSLASTVDNITIRGKGMDRTILSFLPQEQGAEGLSVKGNHITLEDFAVEDTRGDAIKVTGADGLVIRRVRTVWTRGPDSGNGAYGIYPVQCQNVLIEESVASGASDTGIYAGQSRNVIIRRNRVMQNVAGIESENSQFVEIHDNEATDNAGGILVFDLPDLPVQGGKHVRVFNNHIAHNNTRNFAPSGNIVASVPSGTGVLVMASDDVEVFQNDVSDHRTLNMGVVSFHMLQKPFKDERYDAYPEGVHVHHNTFKGGGDSPDGFLSTFLAFKLGKPLPDILYDGIVDKKKLGADGALPEDLRLCVHDNGEARFANADAAHDFARIDRDLGHFACEHPSPAPVTLTGIQ
jgi:parallel beta-helix repeat protein